MADDGKRVNQGIEDLPQNSYNPSMAKETSKASRRVQSPERTQQRASRAAKESHIPPDMREIDCSLQPNPW